MAISDISTLPLSDLTYTEICQMVAECFNESTEYVMKLNSQWGITPLDTEKAFSYIYNQSGALQALYNADGTRRMINTVTTATKTSELATIANATSNSNLATSAIGTVTSPINTSLTTTGTVALKSGVAKAGTFVSQTVSPAIACTAVGLAMGKNVAKLAYNVGGLFFDENEIADLNPENWANCTIDSDITGSRLVNWIMGVDPETQKTQAYIDENVLAQCATYMANKNFFEGAKVGVKEKVDGMPEWLNNVTPFYDTALPIKLTRSTGTQSKIPPLSSDIREDRGVVFLRGNTIEDVRNYFVVQASNTKKDTLPYSFTYNNKTVYHYNKGGSFDYKPLAYTGTANFLGKNTYDSISTYDDYIAWLYVYNSTSIYPIEGVTDQEGAKTPTIPAGATVAEVLQALKEQYPELWENAISNDVLQPDGSIATYNYVPVPTPEADSLTDTEPISGTSTQANPEVDPSTATAPLIELLKKLLTNEATETDINDKTGVGTGDTGSIVVPVGSASALYKIYNPTQAELNSFGGWLWSSDFVDQLLKLFNDPMQAIIGLHKVYCGVPVGGTATIKVGYLDSGVSSNWVSEQYTTIDCGTVSVIEIFGNVLDYDPHTKIYIYLPFIGIQALNTGDVMRGSIRVVYHCDVLTGACLAEIHVIRDGCDAVLYTYTGDCAVQYPISSGSYMGIISSIASVVGGVVGSVATGGATLPIALGAASGLMHAHTNVSRSGGFSGNAGAMGGKTPYIIITREQSALADNFPTLSGYPANRYSTLANASGYVTCKDVKLQGVPATNAELSEIETLLKGGVYV